MSPAEVVTLWAAVRTLWSNAPMFDDAQCRLLAGVFADVPLDAAVAAVQARARRGDRFAPHPGQIVADIVDATSPALPWPDAVRLVRAAASRFDASREDDAAEWLDIQHPGLGAWVRSYGWRSLCMAKIDDPAFGERVQRQLRESFEQQTAQAAAAEAVLLGTAQVRQIGGSR